MVFRKPLSRMLEAKFINCGVSSISASDRASDALGKMPSSFKNGNRSSIKLFGRLTNPFIMLALRRSLFITISNESVCYTIFAEVFPSAS